ncbi:MAG: DUF2244 domain-containing protein [Pseudomonadota bacterium]
MTQVDFNMAAGGASPAAAVSGPNWRLRRDTPIFHVELWPNQSMTPVGYRWVMGITAFMLTVPLWGISGTPVFWGLLPFMVMAFWALWYAIRRNGRNLRLSETLWIWRDEVRVERSEPNGRVLRWQADPMKVRLHLHKDAKVEDYLTVTGGGREIELGSFLAPEERVDLAVEVERALTTAIRS